MHERSPAVALEVCVDNIEGLIAAIEGGADRIELCAALEIGGLTPTAALLRAAVASASIPGGGVGEKRGSGGGANRGPDGGAGAGADTVSRNGAVPIYAMVRPRGGDFRFGAAESELMLAEIETIAAAGLQGVVLGASLDDGRLDHRLLERLLHRAHQLGLGATLHRAIDLCPDLAQATATAVDLGFERILTSGGAVSAVWGLDGLERCFDAAAGRISVMPGAGVNADNVGLLRTRLPLREVHASCSVALPAAASRVVELGFDTGHRRQTCRSKVVALKAALQS